LKLITLVLLLAFSSNSFAIITIHTVGKQKPDDASHDYFIGLLRLALNETTTEYGKAIVKTIPQPGQERMLKLLAAGQFYDVLWAGDSKKRDAELLKIHFPLFKGGLGWRGMIIRHQDKEKFASYNNLSELSGAIACQGAHWPDADILEQSGLTVYRVGHFDAMLQMVALQRCDYLPLSIFEGQAELDIVQESFPNLIFYQDLIIQYSLKMNFFVNANNNKLANRLTLGLTRLNNTGALYHYMKHHPLTKHAFPLTKFKGAKVIKLKNADEHNSELEQFGFKWPNK